MRVISALLLGLGLGAASASLAARRAQSGTGPDCDDSLARDTLDLAADRLHRCEYELRAIGAALDSAAQVCVRQARR